MEQKVAQAVQNFLYGGGHFSVPAVVLMACHAVELYSAHSKEVHGQQKVRLALDNINTVIDQGVAQVAMSQQEADALKAGVAKVGDMINHMIDCFVAVANSPEILKLEQEMHACCGAVLKKRRKA